MDIKIDFVDPDVVYYVSATIDGEEIELRRNSSVSWERVFENIVAEEHICEELEKAFQAGGFDIWTLREAKDEYIRQVFVPRTRKEN